jgi:hypothetical protein
MRLEARTGCRNSLNPIRYAGRFHSDVGFIARQIVSAGLILDCRRMLLDVPPADEARIAVAALDAHHRWDV